MSEKERLSKFELIYREYFKDIFRFLVTRLPSVQDAEDVTTLVFQALWENIEYTDTNLSYRMWLYSTARHKLTDHLRKFYKLEIKNVQYDEDTLKAPDDEKKRKKYDSILGQLLEKLTDREQLFVKLKYKDNLSYPKIAKKMEITESNAKVINNRTLKKLKALWEKI